MNKWHREETYKGMITLSIEVLRALILINGGAATAILLFWANNGGPEKLALGGSLMSFAYGVALAALASLLAYITQNRLYVEETEIESGNPVTRTHQYYQWFALALAFLSVVAFMIGCTCVANSVTP